MSSVLGALLTCYVTSVLWMTSCFHIMDTVARVATAAASLQRRLLANAIAAWYWMCLILDDGGCHY